MVRTVVVYFDERKHFLESIILLENTTSLIGSELVNALYIRKCLHVGNRTYNSSHCMSGTPRAGRHNITSGTRRALSKIKRREGDGFTLRVRRLTEVQTFRTQDLSFPRTKGPYGELSFPGNESFRNFRSQALSFSGTFHSHCPIGLVAALVWVLNYCMFGCDFTLVMLTPL